MCLIAWNWQPGSATPLLLLSNRDEFYNRATEPLHWWNDPSTTSQVLAGRDGQATGTWLGISRSGRLAGLTNYRSSVPMRTDVASRGELVTNFLTDDSDALTYLQRLAARCSDYNPFNLLVFDGTTLLGLESRNGIIIAMEPGIGAVSNANFYTPWPKLTRLTKAFAARLHEGVDDSAQLLSLLYDRTLAEDDELPKTGVSLALEKALSATFIVTPNYGTRACSVVKLHTDHAEFFEESFGEKGLLGTVKKSFFYRRDGVQ